MRSSFFSSFFFSSFLVVLSSFLVSFWPLSSFLVSFLSWSALVVLSSFLVSFLSWPALGEDTANNTSASRHIKLAKWRTRGWRKGGGRTVIAGILKVGKCGQRDCRTPRGAV